MSTKREATVEARRLRKNNPTLTVNVKEITVGNWGVRFSPKGTRDKYVTENPYSLPRLRKNIRITQKTPRLRR